MNVPLMRSAITYINDLLHTKFNGLNVLEIETCFINILHEIYISCELTPTEAINRLYSIEEIFEEVYTDEYTERFKQTSPHAPTTQQGMGYTECFKQTSPHAPTTQQGMGHNEKFKGDDDEI